MTLLSRPEQDIQYPTSDGRPMGETDIHRQQIIDLLLALEHHYRGREDVYVSGNLLMLYEEGNRNKHRSPDVLVALDVPRRERENYKVWEEGKAPDLIFEITSISTRSEDMGEKKGLYCLLGVQEYVLFDPRDEYLEPRLRLYRRVDEEYQPVENPCLLETVNLELVDLDGRLRLRHPGTGELLPTARELDDRLGQAERRAQQAEEEARVLREELRRLRESGD